MSLAFDRIGFNKRFRNGLATIPYSHIPPNFMGHNPQLFNPYIAYNLARAKQLLAEAGYPNGKGFPKLTLDAMYGEELKAAGTFFADCMHRIGIRVEVKQHAFPDLLKRTQRGNHALALLGWRADFPAYSSLFDLIYYPGMGGGICLRDASFDALYDQAMQTANNQERSKLFEQLDAKAAELVPCLLFPLTDNYVLVHQWVKNYVMNPFLWGKAQYLDVLPHPCKSIGTENHAEEPS
jgi:ABC-type transport system substrate-binding protein